MKETKASVEDSRSPVPVSDGAPLEYGSDELRYRLVTVEEMLYTFYTIVCMHMLSILCYIVLIPYYAM
jgi:hypothetical protein